MTKTIRIDDDVYDGLKKLATDPFEDTPNTVIRSLLQKYLGASLLNKSSRSKTKTKKTRTGELTPQSVYENWLLYTLWKDFSGSAYKSEVTNATIKAMKNHSLLSESDFEKVSTGETKAENTIAWGRNRLKEAGKIKNNSSRGIWELTAEGIQEAQELEKVLQKIS